MEIEVLKCATCGWTCLSQPYMFIGIGYWPLSIKTKVFFKMELMAFLSSMMNFQPGVSLTSFVSALKFTSFQCGKVQFTNIDCQLILNSSILYYHWLQT